MLPRFIKQTDIRVGITISYKGTRPFKVTSINTRGYKTYLDGQGHSLIVTICNGVFSSEGVYIHSSGCVNLPKEPV